MSCLLIPGDKSEGLGRTSGPSTRPGLAYKTAHMLQVQSQFETVVKRFNKEQKEVEDLLQIRDQAYLDLLAGSDGQAVVPKQQTSPQKGQNACKVQDSTFTLMISITAYRKQDIYRTVFLIADISLGELICLEQSTSVCAKQRLWSAVHPVAFMLCCSAAVSGFLEAQQFMCVQVG